MTVDLTKHKEQAQNKDKENKLFLQRLGKKMPKDLDKVTNAIHDKVEARINCMECANCCKTISPILTDRDVDKIAKHLRIKAADLLAQHLEIDKEGDFVFRSQPCPFLDDDNACSIYEARPKACKEYPHTDQKRIHQVLKLTYFNTAICPIAFEVVDELKKVYVDQVKQKPAHLR